jgi:DNA-binding response OmpR family regulator
MDQARILNVDDRSDALYIRSRLLRTKGYEVIEAGTGHDALRLVSEEKPNLVVLDVKLPDISGWEVCRKLKSSAETAHIPIVQVSEVFTGLEHQTKSLLDGADAYFPTPFDERVFLGTVSALLGRSPARKSGWEIFIAVPNDPRQQPRMGWRWRCADGRTSPEDYPSFEDCMKDALAQGLSRHDLYPSKH